MLCKTTGGQSHKRNQGMGCGGKRPANLKGNAPFNGTLKVAWVSDKDKKWRTVSESPGECQKKRGIRRGRSKFCAESVVTFYDEFCHMNKKDRHLHELSWHVVDCHEYFCVPFLSSPSDLCRITPDWPQYVLSIVKPDGVRLCASSTIVLSK